MPETRIIHILEHSVFGVHMQFSSFIILLQAPVVQRLDSTIQWINLYSLDNSIGFASTYPVDSDLSAG